MTSQDRPPTRDELMAMAYVDGELDEGGRREFERRMADSRELALEVTELQRLAVLARQLAPPEPVDLEWARLEREGLHRTGMRGGLLLLVLGSAGLAVWAGFALAASDSLSAPVKVLLLGTALGLFALFLTLLRARLRTLPFDPYTEVKR